MPAVVFVRSPGRWRFSATSVYFVTVPILDNLIVRRFFNFYCTPPPHSRLRVFAFDFEDQFVLVPQILQRLFVFEFFAPLPRHADFFRSRAESTRTADMGSEATINKAGRITIASGGAVKKGCPDLAFKTLCARCADNSVYKDPNNGTNA